jgi:TrmH family RNA methyltransferase
LKTVASSANGAVKRARKLLSRKGRDTDAAFLIEGFILIREALRAGIELECVFARGAAPGTDANGLLAGEALEALDLPEGVDAMFLDAAVYDGLADTVTPKGMIAVARKPEQRTDGGGDALLVADRLQDPGNMGTLLRTADATGMDGVVCVKGTTDPFSPKVVRAAAGALFRIPVQESGTPAATALRLKEDGYRLLCLDMDGAVPCWDADMIGRIALVVGNEGGGVAREFLDAADAVVRVPMRAGAESLNAAAAASIAMYERLRQIGL